MTIDGRREDTDEELPQPHSSPAVTRTVAIIAGLGLLVAILAGLQHQAPKAAPPPPSAAPSQSAPSAPSESRAPLRGPLLIGVLVADSVDVQAHTFTYAAEVTNVSPAPLLVVYPFAFSRLPRGLTVDGVIAAANRGYLSSLGARPTPLTLITAGQTVNLWIRAHVDCAASAGTPAGAPTVTVQLRGYPESAAIGFDDFAGPFGLAILSREACSSS